MARCASLASWRVVDAASVIAGQVETGRITGTVTDNSSALLPGVTVSLAGESLIGGVRTQTTDGGGVYSFDRLPPGTYSVKFELTGFRPVEQAGVRVSAAFVASIDVMLEAGGITETLVVTGASPTVDTKSNVQQTVMGQELLEGLPTGRDPWSLAKIIPGVQLSTYDVGGTQSYQQSNMSAHGSLNDDKTFSIDGMAVNWTGGGGGSTMLYYDQGMFEEVNYQTSAIPAEVATGGIYMNMVTKNAGNIWRGDVRFNYANEDLQSDNSGTPELEKFKFPGGNPIQRAYDFNVSGGGAVLRDRLWVNGAYRKWRVDKSNLIARNPDNSPTLDDNDLKNYSVKAQWQPVSAHRVSYSHNYNNKIRGHRRDPPPNFVEDQASLVQTNPASSVQVKYTGIFGQAVFESGLGKMFGVTNYFYQDGTEPHRHPHRGHRAQHRKRGRAASRGSAELAPAVRQLADVYDARARRLSHAQGRRAVRAAAHARSVLGQRRHARPVQRWRAELRPHLQHARRESELRRLDRLLRPGFVDARRRHAQHRRPLRSREELDSRADRAGGHVHRRAPASIGASRPIRRSACGGSAWPTTCWDAARTAIKLSHSRYAQQVGINRVTLVHPFQFSNGSRSWTDRNNDRVPQSDELGTFSGFPEITNRYADADGPDWPYSDELTLGVEHQVFKDVRAGVVYFHRTNRKLVGFRNVRAPSSAYTPVTIDVPGEPTGPGGAVTFYNLSSTVFGQAFIDNVYDNDPVLDQDFDGVELTLTKRFSGRWQLMGGLTLGKNEGGVLTGDLNDPNNADNFPQGIVGDDSKYALRVAGSVMLPWDINLSGSYHLQSGLSVPVHVFGDADRLSHADASQPGRAPLAPRRRTPRQRRDGRPAHLARLRRRRHSQVHAAARNLQPRKRLHCRPQHAGRGHALSRPSRNPGAASGEIRIRHDILKEGAFRHPVLNMALRPRIGSGARETAAAATRLRASS